MQFFRKRSFFVCAAAGEGCALVLTGLLLLPVAWAVGRELLPEAAGAICAPAAAALGVLAPTAVIARSRGREALATGGAIGLCYLLLATLLCALGGEKTAFGPWLAWLAGALCLGSLAGVLLAIRRNTHKRHRH